MWGGGGPNPPPLSESTTCEVGAPVLVHAGEPAAAHQQPLQPQQQQQQQQHASQHHLPQASTPPALPDAPAAHVAQTQQVLPSSISGSTPAAAAGGQTAVAEGVDPDDVVTGVPVAEYAQQWQAMAVQQQALMAWYGQAWLAQMHNGSFAQEGAQVPLQGLGMLAHNQVRLKRATVSITRCARLQLCKCKFSSCCTHTTNHTNLDTCARAHALTNAKKQMHINTCTHALVGAHAWIAYRAMLEWVVMHLAGHHRVSG